MKNLLHKFFVLYLLVNIISCKNSTKESEVKGKASSLVLRTGDTCNRIDNNGLKQGKWYNFKLASNGVIMEGKPVDTLFYRNDTVLTGN